MTDDVYSPPDCDILRQLFSAWRVFQRTGPPMRPLGFDLAPEHLERLEEVRTGAFRKRTRRPSIGELLRAVRTDD